MTTTWVANGKRLKSRKGEGLRAMICVSRNFDISLELKQIHTNDRKIWATCLNRRQFWCQFLLLKLYFRISETELEFWKIKSHVKRMHDSIWATSDYTYMDESTDNFKKITFFFPYDFDRCKQKRQKHQDFILIQDWQLSIFRNATPMECLMSQPVRRKQISKANESDFQLCIKFYKMKSRKENVNHKDTCILLDLGQSKNPKFSKPPAYSHEVPTLKLRQRIAVEGIQSEVNMINNFCAIFALISGKVNKFKRMFMVAFVSLLCLKFRLTFHS